ncbi:hypothetical protein BDV25DRAFT_145324 [Aspergillus avenaceus]|uniref:Uncharacterized protein n=1 Tax=Aspergillus avenaceus TaxID=36643 RepID=A0A5N6TF24_ASPAV|nr:hypothetical protein BDV25DRAFT_145324 [Aspergillus avenaceus]
MSPRNRNRVFSSATKLLEYITFLQGGSHDLEKYKWQMGTSYLWNAVLYVLIGMKHRKTGPDVEKVWPLIGTVFSHYPRVFERSTGAVYRALGQWTLEVWDQYVAVSRAEGLSEPVALDYIDAIRRCRRPDSSSRNAGLTADLEPSDCGQNMSRAGDSLPHFKSSEYYEFKDLLSFETDADEWVQWEQLIGEQGGFTSINSWQ